MKKVFLCSFITMLTVVQMAIAGTGTVKVKLTGVEDGNKVTLTLESNAYLDAIVTTTNGDYQFENVPAGKHAVKVEAPGYNLPPSLSVVVNDDGSVAPKEPLKVAVTRMNDNPDEWHFSWQEDGSTGGHTTTANVNTPPEVEFLGKKIVPADVPSFSILQQTYNLLLADEEEPWTQEYAYRLVETLKTIPYGGDKPAKFCLTADHLGDDIEVKDLGEGFEVRISKDAFYYANPFLVSLDGVRGRFFSKRLHHAMVNYVTDFGRDKYRVNDILFIRFGCKVLDINYEELTRGQTNEDAGRFQEFVPSELASIINMFEELPEGFHKTPHLNYLIRRINGMKHPLEPEAASIAWCVDNGYIEFMESAFGGNNQQFETLRLILHEKTHFLWAYSFSEEIRNDWAEVGGWYPDPNAAEGWSTTKNTEFVTQYAHSKNPNEDMAESVAYYLKDPDKLLSRAPEKYEFIRDRIMHGARYISKIPDHLTFEVLNLFPDYDYPGKIKRVDVKVEGAPEEDKRLTVEIELNDLEGYDDGATGAYVRTSSQEYIDQFGEKQFHFVDVRMSPVDGNDHLLRGEATISKYCKAGYWAAGDITVDNAVGNQRFEGRNDVVVNMYVNNPLEDLESPVYEKGSLRYELTDSVVEDRHVQNLRIICKVTDNIGMKNVMCRLARGNMSYYGIDTFGRYDKKSQLGIIDAIIPDYYPSGDYFVSNIFINDSTGVDKWVTFSESPLDEPLVKVNITTPNPDTEGAEIDLNRMVVYAEPTHPEAPDGETLVTINLYGRDNISGIDHFDYALLDPQGIRHETSTDRDWKIFFDGDPTVWKRYTINCVLPQGSTPGIWGLAELTTWDKAWNGRTYNFVETVLFEPDDSSTNYVLFSELTDDNILNLGLSTETGTLYGFTYRIIQEETGQEISGDSNKAKSKGRLRMAPGQWDANVDVSALPDGELIVIVNILGEDGEVAAVRMNRVTKSSSTAIKDVNTTSKSTVDVYTVNGMLVKKQVVYGAWKHNLQPGIYIVNGKKEIVF